ncbi:pilus assembly protein PilA [Pseudomonas sp. LFM046]|uniref:Flp family type IVb pilin n=1 Tax=Pseudomonas sp. LFM046 TaxID=1608357 RepID=UPI0005CFCEB9|nr:pilus assembly protein PilA [Pseudomonas sp. LFM046]
MAFEGLKRSMIKFVKDEDGLTIVEYAVAGGIITLGVVAAFTLLGTEVDTNIRGLCGAVKSRAGTQAAAC